MKIPHYETFDHVIGRNQFFLAVLTGILYDQKQMRSMKIQTLVRSLQLSLHCKQLNQF